MCSRDDVPADVLDREREIYRAQMASSGKPPQVIEKIVEGKLGSFYEQVVLLDQISIRDPKTTVGQKLKAAIAKLGENIGVVAFRAFQARRTLRRPRIAREFSPIRRPSPL